MCIRDRADPEVQDKSSLSDGDSDSGCSTQNEARSQLPPEVEYGWAECHAHFSLLYDLMTQGGRKVPGKEGEQQPEPYAGKEATEHAPYDYSQGPTREVVVQEPPVLYELMTESPRKASGRDVPDHAMEVEVSMQQYPPPHPQQSQQAQQQQQQQQQQLPHQQQYHHQQQQQQQQQQASTRPQYDDHRLATLQDVAYDRGHVNVSGPAPRYEPRRSLNDLLFAAGLPPVSPPSPPPLSPSDSIPLPGEDAHACEECGKRYSTSSNLARHRQTHRSHGDKKARKCPHCEKVYVSMPAFSMHVRTHNQGCACPHCGKRFSRPWLLQGHIRTHTGEKPFACPQCGKSFADKSNLRAHIQTHSSEKPYVCGRCGKAFALKSYLYKHEESSCMRGERFRPLRRQVSAEC